MITYYKKTVQDKVIKKLPKFKVGSWINVVSPTKKEIDFLVKKFKLDKRNLASGIDQNEIPRIDSVDGIQYIFTNILFNVDDRLVGTYLIVVGKSFILTLSEEQPNFVDKILENEIDFSTTQKLKCLIKLFSLINEDFEKTTISIVKAVQARKRLNIDEMREKDLKLLLEQEDILNDFVSSYYYINLLYDRVIRKIDFFEQDKEILEDLVVEANQGFNLCKSSLKTISNIRNYYVILLSNKLNKIINVLTVFTILVSFPSAISGIYGMNVALPLQQDPFVFYYIVGFVGLLWVAFVFYLKKKNII
jgi:magnesium transporter